MTDPQTITSASDPLRTPDQRPPRWRPVFPLTHLAVLLICWFPLNPAVIEAIRNPYFGIRPSLELLVAFLAMIGGPLSPWLVGASTVYQSLILVGCAILGTGFAIQILWRPTYFPYRIVRLLLWGVTCWLWLALGFVAFAILA